VPCLGFLPGLVCPHHDKVQSNGVLRAIDFDAMLLRHAGEQGICIDHWAALCVDGDAYEVG
jgi:dipeptidase E